MRILRRGGRTIVRNFLKISTGSSVKVCLHWGGKPLSGLEPWKGLAQRSSLPECFSTTQLIANSVRGCIWGEPGRCPKGHTMGYPEGDPLLSPREEGGRTNKRAQRGEPSVGENQRAEMGGGLVQKKGPNNVGGETSTRGEDTALKSERNSEGGKDWSNPIGGHTSGGPQL